MGHFKRGLFGNSMIHCGVQLLSTPRFPLQPFSSTPPGGRPAQQPEGSTWDSGYLPGARALLSWEARRAPASVGMGSASISTQKPYPPPAGYTGSFTEHLLYAKPCAKCLGRTISFCSHRCPKKKVTTTPTL